MTSDLFTHFVRAIKESLQLRQKDFIMRLVVFLKKIMVSAGVSMRGKTCIIFIDPQRTKVKGEYYVGLLRDKLIPECRRLYPDDNYIFQQDSAPSHRCGLAQQFFQANTPDLNDRHIQKSIGQWKQRLRVVTREGRGPIKHLFA